MGCHLDSDRSFPAKIPSLHCAYFLNRVILGVTSGPDGTIDRFDHNHWVGQAIRVSVFEPTGAVQRVCDNVHSLHSHVVH